MSETNPPYIDTTVFFVRGRLRGTVMPDANSMGREERLRAWHGLRVRVYNARLLDPPPTLESHGFELVGVESAVNERQGIDERRETYCQESKRIVEKLTGCNRTRMLNQVYRGAFCGLGPGELVDSTTPENGTVTHYVQRAHTDVSPWVELQREWKAFVQGRHGAIFNVWRSTDLGGPVEHMPLAVCHMCNIVPQDMVGVWSSGLLPDGGDFLGYHLAFDAFQQWFYYPRMAPDEALIVRLYDTREEIGCRRGVFHAAVEDTRALPGVKRRESVDIRVGAVFGEETDQKARRARFLSELPLVPEVLRRGHGERGNESSRVD